MELTQLMRAQSRESMHTKKSAVNKKMNMENLHQIRDAIPHLFFLQERTDKHIYNK